jgi:hypothetical protein
MTKREEFILGEGFLAVKKIIRGDLWGSKTCQ